MNDNVGEMPLEIFGDYTSDMTEQEWSWEYFFLPCNGGGYHFGSSDEFTACYRNARATTGFEDSFGYGREVYAYGSGGSEYNICRLFLRYVE